MFSRCMDPRELGSNCGVVKCLSCIKQGTQPPGELLSSTKVYPLIFFNTTPPPQLHFLFTRYIFHTSWILSWMIHGVNCFKYVGSILKFTILCLHKKCTAVFPNLVRLRARNLRQSIVLKSSIRNPVSKMGSRRIF